MLNNVHDFEMKETVVHQRFLNTYYGFCQYFEKNFVLLLESVNYFNRKDWHYFRWEKRYCLAIFVKLTSTFKVSYELILKGYYAESIMLTRAIYEAVVRMIFIQSYPGKSKELMGMNFKIGAKEKELGIKNSSMYSLMSSFSHGHEIPVFFDLIDVQEGRSLGISIGPQLPSEKKHDFRVAINILMFYLWWILKLIIKSLPELGIEKTWKSKYDGLVDELENTYIRTYVNVKGQPSSIATKGIDEVLSIVKAIPDWPVRAS